MAAQGAQRRVPAIRGGRLRLRRELDLPSDVRARRCPRRSWPSHAEDRRTRLAVTGPALRHAQRGSALVPGVGLPRYRARRARGGPHHQRVHRRADPVAGGGPDMTSVDIAGGRVLDPGQGIDATATVGISDGLITGIEPGAQGISEREDGEVVDASGLLVTPGLVDLHTHLFTGVSHYGVEPDAHCLGRGVTTAVDAGSAGAQTFPALRRYVIEPSETRILAFLHIAVQGMITNLVGELEDIRWAFPQQAIARAREHADLIVGIKVRLGYQMVGNDPAPALRLAREAADELGLPLMVHVIDMTPGLAWLLPYLRRGDIVTHCFHGNEGAILDDNGRVLPSALSP